MPKTDEPFSNIEEPWKLIKLYFDNCHLSQLVRHQLESYNDFIDTQLEKTIQMFNPIIIRSQNDFEDPNKNFHLDIHINVENLVIYRAQIFENNGATKMMFPNQARVRNFTYSSLMTVDLKVQYIITTGDTVKIIPRIFKKINIGKMPIMLRSSICILSHYKNMNEHITEECKYDPGGYFIINGSEKTVITQERTAENKIFCFTTPKNTKWSHMSDIKSVPDDKIISPKQVSIMKCRKNNGFGFGLYVQLPKLKIVIPLFILFKALGIISDKEIASYIVLDLEKCNPVLLNSLKASMLDAQTTGTKEDAINYMIKHVTYIVFNMTPEEGYIKKRAFLLEMLERDFLPHCKTHANKIYFLGYMTNTLLKVSLGILPETDRDSYKNKRLDTCGSLLNNLFRNYYNKFTKDLSKQVSKEINIGSWRTTLDYYNIMNDTNIYKIIKSLTIENGFKRALSTGDFGIKHYNSTKVGVAQVLSRMTYISALSHLRRVNTPIDKSGKLIAPRKLHNTSCFYLCCAETPEGHSVGVVKNLCYLTHITNPSESECIYTYVKDHILSCETLKPCDTFNKVKVIVNGTWVGIAKEPLKLYAMLKEYKFGGILNIYTSIVFDYANKEINICNSAGRLTRPVLRMGKDNKLLFTPKILRKIEEEGLGWSDLLLKTKLKDSIIEYIDPMEQNSSVIAMKWTDSNPDMRYTHCEIHPSTLFGVLASCIPFPEHNQAPRNTYQCAMGKQAMGMYVTNFDKRMDKTAYVLNYSGKPLVDTRIMNMLGLNVVPSGCQVIVAIMTHTGYNQEDSVLLNKGSIDRGLFQATIYHTEKDEDKKLNGTQEVRSKPNKKNTKGMKLGNYDKINADGVVDENTILRNRDIFIAKMLPIKEARNDITTSIKYQDESKIFKTDEEVYVDKNMIDRNGDGYTFCKTRLRATRKPVIGDKFSSRHGQKGTVGNIIEEANMPFCGNGLKPDIIINPHAIPSRMTIAQLKETLLGKVLLELGMFGDGTSFTDLSVKSICSKLLDVGYEVHGNEVMYNGETGEQLSSSIFIGPCFYQRLKHMVIDKAHSRSIGPCANLTRQPLEGRRNVGGLRFGEMERDCMISHGAARFTIDRLLHCSDKFTVTVCKSCGMIVPFNAEKNINICKTCNNRVDFATVDIPYACKLLSQELISMNIAPRFVTR